MKPIHILSGNCNYVGGKHSSAPDILLITAALAAQSSMADNKRFIEVFTGSAVLSISALANKVAHTVWLNDLDANLRDLHNEILHHPERLINRIPDIPPTKYIIDGYMKCLNKRDELDKKKTISQSDWAYWKYIVQSSVGHSRGERAGSCDWGYLHRWNPYQLRKKVRQNHHILHGHVMYGECTGLDFREVLAHCDRGVIFIDPPYPDVDRNRLYRKQMSIKDHADLRDAILDIGLPFLITYNDHPYVRELYQDHPSFSSIRVKVRGALRMGTELWIASAKYQRILNQLHFRSVERLPLNITFQDDRKEHSADRSYSTLCERK